MRKFYETAGNVPGKERAAGILLPISALPSRCGIGTLGEEAFRFVDFLWNAGCKVWQVLPLEPTTFGNSPYSSCASGVFNPYYIDLDLLHAEGLLELDDYQSYDWYEDMRRVNYGKQYRVRINILKKAFSRFSRKGEEWDAFLKIEKFHDYALFMALKEQFGGVSHEEWDEYSEYDEALVSEFERNHRDEVEFWQFTQYLFLRQWRALKAYANKKGVKIMGDIPIYVARDSVEMWKYKRDLFQLDDKGNPAAQAGVPPDAFSDDGQLWGNPVYDWEKMQADGFSWWHRRIADALEIYDILRIDHFIGFVRYWCIPIGAKDAKVGEWKKGPGAELFRAFAKKPIVAEDLGLITWSVRRELDKTGYAGMKILQNAFDGDFTNEHKPSRYMEDLVAYTGTHDNVPLLTCVQNLEGDKKERFVYDLKVECFQAGAQFVDETDRGICRSIFALLFASKARLVIFPYQDALLLGEEARINAPSTVSNENWSYRFIKSDFHDDIRLRIFDLAKTYNRL